MMTFLEFVLSKQLGQKKGWIRQSPDCRAVVPESWACLPAQLLLQLPLMCWCQAEDPEPRPAVPWLPTAVRGTGRQERWSGRWEMETAFEAVDFG